MLAASVSSSSAGSPSSSGSIELSRPVTFGAPSSVMLGMSDSSSSVAGMSGDIVIEPSGPSSGSSSEPSEVSPEHAPSASPSDEQRNRPPSEPAQLELRSLMDMDCLSNRCAREGRPLSGLAPFARDQQSGQNLLRAARRMGSVFGGLQERFRPPTGER